MFSLDKANYNLPIVKFNADECLGNHIKEPFPNYSFFWMIVGKPGSGKTSLLINSLTCKGENRIYHKVFDKITLVMPPNSEKSIQNNPFADMKPDQKFANWGQDVVDRIVSIRKSFDEEIEPVNNDSGILTDYINKLKEEEKSTKKKKGRQKRQLLIIDDVTAYLKDDPSLLIELGTNRRHLKLSIVLMVQFLRSVPLPVRSQVTHLTLFKPANEKETELLKDEYVNMKKNLFDDLTRWVWETKHDYLMIDKDNSLYYKNLQKINFNNLLYGKENQESKKGDKKRDKKVVHKKGDIKEEPKH